MTLGRIAYEAGRVGPLAWDDLHGRTREHWERTAQAVAREVRNRTLVATAEQAAVAEAGKTSPSQLWGTR